MWINTHSEKPIFLQIAEQLEDAIVTQIYAENTQVPSTNELAGVLGINPHTVLKGVNLLVQENILYKKRGLGMFVCEGAVQRIQEKRRGQFYEEYVLRMLEEAKKLQMNKKEILRLLERGFENERN